MKKILVLIMIFSIPTAGMNQQQDNKMLEVGLHLGNIKKIQDALEHGASANQLDSIGSAPLHLAAIADPKTAVIITELLLAKGANPNAQDKKKNTPLHEVASAYYDNGDVAALLIKNGADIYAENDKGKTPLDLARAKHGEKSLIYKVLDEHRRKQSHTKGISTHEQEQAQENLFQAINSGDKKAIQASLANGAKINQVNTRSTYKTLPLQEAILIGNFDIIECLVENGADVNQENDQKNSPLNYAADLNFFHPDKVVAIIEFLLKKGARPNVHGYRGVTPLERSLFHCKKENKKIYYDVAKLLVDNGALVDAQDDDGKSPLDIARERCGEDSEIYKFLVEELRKTKQSRVKGISL